MALGDGVTSSKGYMQLFTQREELLGKKRPSVTKRNSPMAWYDYAV